MRYVLESSPDALTWTLVAEVLLAGFPSIGVGLLYQAWPGDGYLRIMPREEEGARG